MRDALALLHELQVHQVEIDLQAQELSASRLELEVALAVAGGKSNREVAEQLFIAERTVKAHLGAVFEKLGVRDRLQLALRLSGRAATRPAPKPL